MTAPFLVAFRDLISPSVLIVSISGNVWTLQLVNYRSCLFQLISLKNEVP